MVGGALLCSLVRIVSSKLFAFATGIIVARASQSTDSWCPCCTDGHMDSRAGTEGN